MEYWRSKLINVMDVVLRVPPLFVVETLLNGTFTFTDVEGNVFILQTVARCLCKLKKNL